MNDRSETREPPRRRRGRPRLKPEQRQDNNSTVQALERGLVLLQLLSKSGSASLTDLSQEVGLPASTAYRMLSTLQKLEFVSFDAVSQEWAVGVEAFTVGSSYSNRANLAEASRPVMRQLMLDTGETSNLAILTEGAQVTFLTQVECNHPIRAFHLPGTRSPAHSSGIGKTLLAEHSVKRITDLLDNCELVAFTDKTFVNTDALLENLQLSYQRGWAFDDEERHTGMRCIAAAIHNHRAEPVAGISVSGPTARFADDDLHLVGEKVRRAAAEVTCLIGGVVPDYESRNTGPMNA